MAYVEGRATANAYRVNVPERIDVKAIHANLDMMQEEFAGQFRLIFKLSTVRQRPFRRRCRRLDWSGRFEQAVLCNADASPAPHDEDLCLQRHTLSLNSTMASTSTSALAGRLETQTAVRAWRPRSP